jgi:hypothetical protein
LRRFRFSTRRRGRRPLRARTRARIRGGLLLLTLAAAAVVVVILLSSGSSPTTTSASRAFVQSWFQDDQYLLNPPVSIPGDRLVQKTLITLKGLGVDVIRVQLLWDRVAPDPLATTAPHGFDAADPSAYPPSGWAPYDRLLLLAHAMHMQVNLDVTAPGPLWAMRTPPIDPTVADHYAPSVAAFRQFVTAAGRRYDGRQRLQGTNKTLPRVDDWSIWNEPNQPGWLAPQTRTVDGVQALDSPRLYRAYADAAFGALAKTGHGPSTDTVLIGELAPEGCTARGPGCTYPSYDEPLEPLQFLRAMYCVGQDYQPLTGRQAALLHCAGNPKAFVKDNRALFDATGFAHHPYSFSSPPDRSLPQPDSVPLSDLGRLDGALDRIFASYGVQRKLPIYLTEYGYETNPPDIFRGMPPAIQSRYLNEGQYLAMHDPRVRAMSQFLLYDSAPEKQFPVGSAAYWSSFQTGLLYVNGAPKPSFASYRLPIFLSQTRFKPGSQMLVWGMLRLAPNDTRQTAMIQWRPVHGDYRTIAQVTTMDPSGVLTAHVTPPGSGAVRIAWTSASGTEFHSRAVGVFSR